MKTSPLPPKEKHLETVIHVYELRQRAKTLLEKGKRQLNEAKQGGERMILSGIGICL